MSAVVVAVVAVWAVWGVAGALIARRRGHETGSGAIVGVLFGPIGLLLLAVGPRGER